MKYCKHKNIDVKNRVKNIMFTKDIYQTNCLDCKSSLNFIKKHGKWVKPTVDDLKRLFKRG